MLSVEQVHVLGFGGPGEMYRISLNVASRQERTGRTSEEHFGEGFRKCFLDID